jgi:conjugative coupling factor TraD (TOL family)
MTMVLEAKLRPAVEAWSAWVAMGIGVIAVAAPWALMMPRGLGWVMGAAAFAFGVWRLSQALEVLRYRHGLKFYRVTRVAPASIPAPTGELYLGEGFEWGQLHTQRLTDATRPDAKVFCQPSALESAAKRLGARVDAWAQPRSGLGNQAHVRAAARAALAVVHASPWWNPLKPFVDLGGTPLMHGVGLDEAPITLREASRNGHLLVKGTTRVGKTRLLELLATQDIHNGHVTIVIDPKGDADLMLRIYAEAARANRLDQLYIFHLGYPDISARYNGIGNFARITEVASRATNALPSSGNSAAFKEFSWRFTNLVAQAQVALGRVPTYDTVLRDMATIDRLFMDYARLVLDHEAKSGRHRKADAWPDRLEHLEGLVATKKAPVPRALMDRSPALVAMILFVKELQLPDPVLEGLGTAVSYEKSFFEKITASLGPFLEKLTTGAVGKLISPDYFDPTDPRPIFDWMQVIRQRGIVYVGLDALSDSVVSSAVGNSMLADLVSVGGKIYKTGVDPHHPDGKVLLPTVCCHFDEVNEIAGPEFVPMVNKLGGAGFWITAYTQSLWDFEARVGDKAKAGQIIDNFNHLVMMRVRSVATANLLAEQMPQVDVTTLQVVSGVTDGRGDGEGPDFTSANQDRVGQTKVPMITAANILELPQGQAFVLKEGNRRFKIRIPLADSRNDAFVPASIREVAQRMRAAYRTSEHWAKETDWLGDQPIGVAGVNVIATDLANMANLAPAGTAKATPPTVAPNAEAVV